MPGSITHKGAHAVPSPRDCGSSCGRSAIEVAPPRDHCCGRPLAEPRASDPIPGYILWHFVDTFHPTPAGPIPRIKSTWQHQDWAGTLAVRLGIGRFRYEIAPGLYAVGSPGPEDPVLVTANFKLTFDSLRRALAGRNAWILVLNTHGINVWCAAGKGTFSTEEIIRRVKAADLEKIVSRRQLIVPQLGAIGVAAHKVRKGCAFKVIWGPIRARDLGAFLDSGCEASPDMRQVTFGFLERLVLVPVEINNLAKPFLWLLASLFLLSGIGVGFFSLSAAVTRTVMGLTAGIAGIAAGAVIAPLLLPWLPGRPFALKGAVTGAAAGILVAIGFWQSAVWPERLALVLFTTAVSSFLTMNFTGSTPFTSPTGVEKEMRRAIPCQTAAAGIGVAAWVFSGFLR